MSSDWSGVIQRLADRRIQEEAERTEAMRSQLPSALEAIDHMDNELILERWAYYRAHSYNGFGLPPEQRSMWKELADKAHTVILQRMV